MIIEGAPISIALGDIAEWLSIIGVDATLVPRNTAMTSGQVCITMEVHALDADGHPRFVGPDGEIALHTHTITIPITDE